MEIKSSPVRTAALKAQLPKPAAKSVALTTAEQGPGQDRVTLSREATEVRETARASDARATDTDTGAAPAKSSNPLPATLWNEHAVNVVNQRGQEQKGISQEQVDRNSKLATESVANGGKPDLAALAKEIGVDPTRIDPKQLEAANRYVTEGDAAGQAERLRKTLNNFNVLDNGMPKLGRQETNDLIWGAAKVPGHATQKLDEAGLAQSFQDVANAMASPGKHNFKVGQHTLELGVNDKGVMTDSKTKAPSFWSKAANIAKVALPIVATVAAFVPGVGTAVALGLRAASSVVSGINAIKSKNLLGVVSSLAGAVGAGFGLGAGANAVKIAGVADSVGSGARGVQSIKQGGVLGILGGVAGVAGAAAGISGLDKAGKISDVSDKVSNASGQLETAQRFRGAAGAVEAAEKQLAAAQASGNPEIIAMARKQLAEAKSAKSQALLTGLGTVAQLGANHTNGNASQALGFAARGLNMTSDLKAKDYLGAAAQAGGAAGQATGNQKLKDSSALAEQSNNFRLASQAESQAQKALDAAQRTLQMARNSKDPQAIKLAEEAFNAAKERRDFAQTNAAFAGDGLAATGQRIGARVEKTRVLQANLKELEPTLAQGKGAGDLLKAVSDDPRAKGGFQTLVAEAQGKLDNASSELSSALLSGDKTRIAEARQAYEAASKEAVQRASLIHSALNPKLEMPRLATDITLPARPTVAATDSATASAAASSPKVAAKTGVSKPTVASKPADGSRTAAAPAGAPVAPRKPDYDQAATQEKMDKAVAEYRRSIKDTIPYLGPLEGIEGPIDFLLFNARAVKNHWSGGALDMKAIAPGQTFDVPGRGVMEASEFGNYVTAYTTYTRAGAYGEFGTRLGGHVSQFLEESFRRATNTPDPNAPNTLTDDPESKYLIQMGINDAIRRLQSEGRLPANHPITPLGPPPEKLRHLSSH